MIHLLWLVPAIPFLGFIILAIFGGRLPKKAVAGVGVSSIGVSAVLAILTSIGFASFPGKAFVQTLWNWVGINGFSPSIAFHLDSLSILMMLVVTFVGFLIHLYSTVYMAESEGYSRFFAYMNLFVGSMLTLVLADNLLFFYLGWEGVGLCSYLLIGFWYKNPVNGAAARKAFIVTRVGDAALAVGLFIVFTQLGTLNIQEMMTRAQLHWLPGSVLAGAVAALFLGGAVGKSAQLPLQTWLPDAMAGPTPVSALIHAATMVTAGVYLIARTNVIFELAPVVQLLVAIIGALTLLISGFSALTQRDIKRVLAYSTISQIGYMFLALGVGAYSAALFHFMTHAFFKALLFLGAGVLIISLHEEHDMFKMGGMRKHFPVVFWTFLIAGGSLAAFPFITAGFYSKDLIIEFAGSSVKGSFWFWLAGAVGAFVTSLYTFRMVFVTFFGETKTEPHKRSGLEMDIALVMLAILSIIGGFINLPSFLGRFTPLSDFLGKVLPAVRTIPEGSLSLVAELVVIFFSLSGIYLAYLFHLRKPELAQNLSRSMASLHRFWFVGWGFDWFYDRAFVRPYVWFARVNKNDFVDLIYTGLAWLNRWFNYVLSLTQNGKVRYYAAGIAIGAVIYVAITVFA
jgi:NADH-quinone oxidoreductase subunit L